jgi:hypothetical protein
MKMRSDMLDGSWSAVAHGAVIRLLRDKISTTLNPTPVQRIALNRMPEVTARRSRYSYGILANRPISTLIDFNPDLDEVHIDPEGIKVTSRIGWYLKKVRALETLTITSAKAKA